MKHQRLSAAATGMPEALCVAGALSPRAINLNLQAVDREGILHELVALVIPPGQKRYADQLFKALKERESLCSTCVNDGVAVPHSRNALIGLVDKPLIAYGRHVKGVAFGALDGNQVHHFFLLCAPNVREHLQLLARLSRLVNNPDFRAKLNQVTDPEALISLVRDAELFIC